jgi:hypothetical protein
MTARSPSQIGQANRRTGKNWQLACASWLRANGWPNAAYEIRNGSSDIIGTGDMAVECTVTTWDKIWIKLDQSQRDGRNRGLLDWCTWKKRTGKTDPGEGAVLVQARKFWSLMAELDAYRRREMDAALEFDRGFRLGRQERGEAS